MSRNRLRPKRHKISKVDHEIMRHLDEIHYKYCHMGQRNLILELADRDKHLTLTGRQPKIFNTDQGSQFTSQEWVSELEKRGVEISMDGKGCWRDNVFIERLWRSIKYEKLRLWSYSTVPELEGLDEFLQPSSSTSSIGK